MLKCLRKLGKFHARASHKGGQGTWWGGWKFLLRLSLPFLSMALLTAPCSLSLVPL